MCALQVCLRTHAPTHVPIEVVLAVLRQRVAVGVALLDHVHEVGGENEGDALALHAELGLEVTEHVTEVDVEQLKKRDGRRHVCARW